MTKLIAIEEHFLTPGIRHAWASSALGQESTAAFDRGEIEARLDDLDEGRIGLMDEAGVDVQVLSVTTPALHNLEPEESVDLARKTNNLAAATIAKHPTRFQGFATLPTAAPAEAALEFERCVRQLGFAGTMLCGRTRDKNLDHPEFRPILQAAARLKVPVFVHPQIPQRAVREVYYSGFGEPIDTAFAAFGLGWHYEAGIQFLRLMLAGIFDELPDLQIILGHWARLFSSTQSGWPRWHVSHGCKNPWTITSGSISMSRRAGCGVLHTCSAPSTSLGPNEFCSRQITRTSIVRAAKHAPFWNKPLCRPRTRSCSRMAIGSA